MEVDWDEQLKILPSRIAISEYKEIPRVDYKMTYNKVNGEWTVIGRIEDYRKALKAFREFYPDAQKLLDEMGLQVFVVKKDSSLGEFWANGYQAFIGYDGTEWVRMYKDADL